MRSCTQSRVNRTVGMRALPLEVRGEIVGIASGLRQEYHRRHIRFLEPSSTVVSLKARFQISVGTPMVNHPQLCRNRSMWSNDKVDPTAKTNSLDSTVAIFSQDSEVQSRIIQTLNDHRISFLPPESQLHRMANHVRTERAAVFVIDPRESPDEVFRLANMAISVPDIFVIFLGEEIPTKEALRFGHVFLPLGSETTQFIQTVSAGFKYRQSIWLGIDEGGSFATACAWCHRIKKSDSWVDLPSFFIDEPITPLSHGICESCAEALTGKAERP